MYSAKEVLIRDGKRAFQKDAYCPFANHSFFGSHQMSSPGEGRGGGPQVNKFEQVSSLGHQISLAVGRAWGSLYDKVQCIIGNGGHMMFS